MSSGDIVNRLTEDEENWGRFRTRKEDPAIGLILTQNNGDAVTRVSLRAAEHGYTVFLTYQSDPNQDILASLRELDVEIATPAARSDDLELVALLFESARRAGYPGLIYHENTAEYIDYDRTAAAVDESTSPLVRPVTSSCPPSLQEPEVIVSIPVYNEADTIRDVVTECLQYTDQVVVVDDGSSDGTPDIASEAGATVIRHRTNKGYGGALKTGFQEAYRRSATSLVVLDGDGQHDPSDIPEMVETLQSERLDIVVGNRFGDSVDTEIPVYRLLGLKIVNGLTNLSLGIVRGEEWIRDTQSGFRVYGERAIETLARDASLSDGMAASTDILYHVHSKNYAIGQVGTEIDYGVDEASSRQPVAHGLVLVSNILKKVESQRPMTLLGIPGLGVVLLGFLIGMGALSNFYATETLPLFPTLFSATLILVGTVACFTSVILHSMNVLLQKSAQLDQRSTDG